MSETNYRGIDYGMGKTNVDQANGIRYGVISMHEVCQAWCDSSEGYYGEPCCPKCGNEFSDIDEDELLEDYGTDETGENLQLPEWYDRSCEYHCPECEESYDSDNLGDCEPLSHYVDDEEYSAEQSNDDSDIFITKSPYYTRAQFCSPCAPGAGYLMNPCESGEKTYCFGHDWFDGGKAPYPVFKVSDDAIVEPS